MNTVYVCAYSPPSRQLSILKRLRPTTVIAYPSALHILALHIIARGEQVESVRYVFTGAETLTTECCRAVNEAFGVMPVDLYNTAECGNVACQCQPGGCYHLNRRTSVVELEPTGLPEHSGGDVRCRVLVTPMHYRAMPLIRYVLEDEVVMAARCHCGERGPVIRRVLGRPPSFLYGADGGLTSSLLITRIMTHTAGVYRWRASQPSPGRLSLRMVADTTIRPGLARRVREAIRSESQLKMDVEIEWAGPKDPFKSSVFIPWHGARPSPV